MPAEGASAARSSRLRRVWLVCLAASLPVPLVGFFSWLLGAVALAGLLASRRTRLGAAVGLAVLVGSVLVALLLGGTVRGVSTGASPSSAWSVVAPTTGALAAWFATAAFLLLAPGVSPRALPAAGAALVLGGYGAMVLTVVSERDGAAGSVVVPEATFFVLFALGALLLAVALVWDLVGVRPRGARAAA